MRRREFIALISSAAMWPLAAGAQQVGRTYRLGGLSGGPRTQPLFVAMFAEIRRMGFVEGQNLIVDWHEYGPHINLIPEIITELVKSQVDVIFATGDHAIRAAQRATTTIPILGSTDDMVEAGLVRSLARPEGNTTGTSLLSAELDGKRQEILIEALPGLEHIAALSDSNRTTGSRLKALQGAARARKVELSIHQIASPEEIPAAIDAAKASGAAALNVLASPVLYSNRQTIVARVAALGLPAIYQFPEVVEEGGFIGYGPGVIQLYRETVARQLVELLRGIRPADVPVEQPTKFELAINLKTAKALGLSIPETLLVRADDVIE